MEKEEAQNQSLIKEELPSYIIDLERFEANNRSFLSVTRSRMCPMHRGEATSVGAKGAKAGDYIFKTIGECCSKAEDFLPRRLPIREAVFRLLLANRNKPINPIEIEEKLREWWREDADSRDLSPQLLVRLLDSSEFYGFKLYVPQEKSKS
ncbi:MAG: hypothetical protein HYX82_03340 [Chloroflexi bacterium]|nr:hypothetical protein [Chloroflexota bacterium]